MVGFATALPPPIFDLPSTENVRISIFVLWQDKNFFFGYFCKRPPRFAFLELTKKVGEGI
jgi:hypothetical protein